MLTLYYLGVKLSHGGKISGCGVKIIHRRKIYRAAEQLSRVGAGGPNNFFPKKSHSNENCCTRPKIPNSISLYIAGPLRILIHYQKHHLDTLPNLYPILMFGRNYTLSYYIAETILYLNTLPKPYPIQRRNIPYLNTWPGDLSPLLAAIAYLNT